MLYWAYGSNLDPAGMRRRCPGAKRIAPLVIDKGRLVFRGVADVVSWDDDSKVPGGIWEITREHERSLDSYEGVVHGLYKKRYLKLLHNGEKRDCLYYQMNRSGVQPPSEAYLRVIESGYDYFGLDKSWLNIALEESWSNKSLTPALRKRYDRKGRPALARQGTIAL